jgi:L-ascorbate metabolism protein UlaG (beta-lactamase superfamily)
MSIAFTWLGHAAFQFDVDGHNVLVDPFLTGNPAAAAHADSMQPEIVFLSHAHGDHLGDTVAIAQRTNAKVVANNEIAHWCSKQGVGNTHGQNPGGSFDHGFVTAKWTVAFHSSSFPDGTYGGEPNGFILTANDSGLKAYFAGDTALFSDMRLIGDHGIDVAFVPIGDNYTMGVDDSVKAVQFIRPRYVVPMHYDTFPLIAQDAEAWARRISGETDATPIVLTPGGSAEVK